MYYSSSKGLLFIASIWSLDIHFQLVFFASFNFQPSIFGVYSILLNWVKSSMFLDMKLAPFVWDSAMSFGSKSQMGTIQKLHIFSLFDFVLCK